MGLSGALLTVEEQGWGKGAEARAASGPPGCGAESQGLSAQLKSTGESCRLTSISPWFPCTPLPLDKERGQDVSQGSAAAFAPHPHFL